MTAELYFQKAVIQFQEGWKKRGCPMLQNRSGYPLHQKEDLKGHYGHDGDRHSTLGTIS